MVAFDRLLSRLLFLLGGCRQQLLEPTKCRFPHLFAAHLSRSALCPRAEVQLSVVGNGRAYPVPAVLLQPAAL